jgi:hypothetical protein
MKFQISGYRSDGSLAKIADLFASSESEAETAFRRENPEVISVSIVQTQEQIDRADCGFGRRETLAEIQARLRHEDDQRIKEKNKVEFVWGCLPWILILIGAGLVGTPLVIIGIIMICIGAGMGGYAIAKQ